MLKYGSIGGVLGCALGSGIGFMCSTAKPVPPPEGSAERGSDEASQAVGDVKKLILPVEVRSTLEKLTALSTPAGRVVCESLGSLLSSIGAAVDLIGRDDRGGRDVPDNLRMVQVACTRAGRARVLLEKLYDVERGRFGQTDEFKVYQGTIDIGLKEYESALNNYLTAHLSHTIESSRTPAESSRTGGTGTAVGPNRV